MKRIRCSLRRILAGFAFLAGLVLSGYVLADSAGIYNSATFKSASGEAVYTHICQGCHMPDGKGATGAGAYPAFAGNPKLASASYMAATILYGRRDMPSFIKGNDSGSMKVLMGAATLSDEQVAEVVNYIRTHFGNHYTDRLTAAQVAALHPNPN